MRTELYKMWIEYCCHPDRALEMDRTMQCKLSETGEMLSKTGEISFYLESNRNDSFIVEWMSPEYKAWNAWKNVKWNSRAIIDFLVKNWNLFKQYFPATCITLEMYGLDTSDLLNSHLYYERNKIEMLKQAIVADLKSRKKMKI